MAPFQKKKRRYFLVFWIFAVGAVLPFTTQASSGWSQKPAWSPSSGEGYSSKRSDLSRDSQYPLAPFAPGSNNIALDVGQVFLMGDLGSNFADSIGSQIHYTYGVSDMFGFDASLGTSDHSDGKFGLTTLLMGLRTNLSWYDKVVPYLISGLGFYKLSRQITPTASLSPVVFGIHLGPGVDLELTKQLFFGAALTFHDVFGTQKVSSIGPVDFDGTYTSFLLHIGFSF